jgi:hypothetical protein
LTTYDTKSLYIAAALLTIGMELQTIERRATDPQRAVFTFSDENGACRSLAQQYRIDQFPPLQPQAFINKVFYCRDRAEQAR